MGRRKRAARKAQTGAVAARCYRRGQGPGPDPYLVHVDRQGAEEGKIREINCGTDNPAFDNLRGNSSQVFSWNQSQCPQIITRLIEAATAEGGDKLTSRGLDLSRLGPMCFPAQPLIVEH